MAAALLVAALVQAPVAANEASAQATPAAPTIAQQPKITPLPQPVFDGELPLYADAAADGPGEQWGTYLGGPIVRNVINPTLIPLLPAPGTANGTAVIFAPGGAFLYLDMSEADPQRLADQGVTVFILKYRTKPTDRDSVKFLTDMYAILFGMVAKNAQPDAGEAIPLHATPEALEDALAAVRLVRSRAGEWGIDPARVGFMGGSAGAITAIDAGYAEDAGARPDFIAALFGPKQIDPVPTGAPPLFIAASNDDPLFPGRTEQLVAAWSKAGRPVEAHFYERGGHGLAKGTTGEGWFDALTAWMKMHGWLGAPD